MDNNLSKKAKNYGACDAYGIWSIGIRSAVDQRLQAVEVPPFLTHLSTCGAFHHVQTQEQHKLDTIKVEDPVPRNDSIWTVSDISAYIEAKLGGALALHFLSDGHLVSSSMRQNLNPGFAK